MDVSDRDREIMKHIAWFVGRTLSYIDVTVESTEQANDRYSKKEVLKKLFEKEIYDVRNNMLTLETSELLKTVKSQFEELVKRLTTLVLASIPDRERRENFIVLLDQSSADTQEKLREALELEK